MSQKKKQIRQQFRDSALKRDNYRCVTCGWDEDVESLDVHHVQNRNLLPNGGYVKENGISLCPECHIKAEEFHSAGKAPRGYMPDDLYALIGSSYELAVEKSKRLK
jgi:5-methylcytosine-specific restriction endonuclease McrA